MINSRLIGDLSLNCQAYFYRFCSKVEIRLGLIYGEDWGVCSTKRDQEYQDYIYEQGRTRPGPVVTWTRESNHLNGDAFDVFILEDGKAVWVSPKYQLLAEVGKSVGLDCGFYWTKKKRDKGHYQLPLIVG